MCAIYGFLNYGKLINHRLLTKILKELSIAAEVRGTDATGISYVRNGKNVTFKKPKPAHKVKLYFPKDTTAVIGHTRFATQGDEKLNYNNHPFDSPMGFALAHNGVLYNDKRLRTAENLPYTQIETDSYVAVQLIEKTGIVDMESIKDMTEKVEGSFVFTILKNDNTLYLVKGSNPITIYHYIDLGLYIYASTKDILDKALKSADFHEKYEPVKMVEGDILQLNSDGTIESSEFKVQYENPYSFYSFSPHEWWGWCEEEGDENDLMFVCNCYGVEKEDIKLLKDYGYTYDEIEEMIFVSGEFEEILNEIKAIYSR